MAANKLLYRLIDRAAVRRRLLNFGPLNSWYRHSANRRRAKFAGSIATNLDPRIAGPLERLRHDAITVERALDWLPESWSASIDRLAATDFSTWDWPENRIAMEAEELMQQAPWVYRLGLETQLLDLAEAYLGEPCYYLSCAFKREPADSRLAGTRQWHLDMEDDRMLRVLVYLNPVEPGGGAFEYLSRDDAQVLGNATSFHTGLRTDEEVAAHVPRERWNAVLGPTGTVMLFDGIRLFHRAGVPDKADRLSLTLSYCSRHPKQLYQFARLPRALRRDLVDTLSPRQRACVPPPRIG